ncbi:ABC transporter ATP-binding protein [Actinocrinis puniceicyclus]|uniref:ABC transporter ATP-binding protein n=1 Tax=Actinocrinis puniceicyclus TaxID=977794 RepID=A0A8J8BEV9_9ACTN|nr:ABC transporter ATP-binding protein [Actinocrinis puniceicyclus]MBS2965556.1 ABC transporter ATP-binding protein [Actinocrinis puniceicyclus]
MSAAERKNEIRRDAARGDADRDSAGPAGPVGPVAGGAGPAAPREAEQAIVCEQLVRIYKTDALEVQALQGLDLRVAAGELTALVGASGSGKSTLLAILAGLDTPTAGSVRVAGHELAGLDYRGRLHYRRSSVGFVWQNPAGNLLPHLTAAQNVALPMRLNRAPRTARRERALALLDSLGVAHCRDRVPARMSGGEQQRTAIATALANTPRVLLADEPTGELDCESAETVFEGLRTANRDHGVTVLIVTHDTSIAGQVRRTVAIRDGRTSTETLRRGGEAPAAGQTAGDGSEHEAERLGGYAVEYAMVDRVGRLQLPREFTESYGIRDRVRLTREPGHVGVWPDQHEPTSRGPSRRADRGNEDEHA